MITKLFIRISVFCEVSVVELQKVDETLKCSGVINDKSKEGRSLDPILGGQDIAWLLLVG